VERIGRGFRIRREWLDAFLAAREVQPIGATTAPALPPPTRRRGAPSTGAPFRSVREACTALLPLCGRRP
jgi:hypothetical protein